MGIFDWLQKNGPGSPGSTAKVIAKLYKTITAQDRGVSETTDRSYGFTEIVNLRKHAERQYGRTSMLSDFDTQKIVKECYGTLTLLVFNIMYLETAQFRASLTDYSMVKSTLNVIRSVIEEVLPERQGKEGGNTSVSAAMSFMEDNRP